MKIKRLTLSDYGPYKGKNTFNLSTTPDEPIVLFVGENGAGKTTLFNAIQICLHGRSAFGGGVSKREYHNTIRSKLHESNGTTATEASIRLEFDYGSFGTTENYVVERHWRDRGKSIEESLTVLRNGSKLADLQEDQWADFLKELIPPGISQLFFFDGEKVQKLASAIEEGDDFEESLFSLLGLDLVDRLDADLSIYLSNKLDESGHDQLAEKIKSLRDDKGALEAEHEEVEEKLETKREELERVSEEVDQKEAALAQEGGSFAEKRSGLKDRRKELDTEIETVEEQIQELARGAYPFALAPELCRAVVEQLEDEKEAETEAAAQARVVAELDDLADEDNVWSDLNIPEDASADVLQRIQSTLSDRFADTAPSEPRLSADFSDRERTQMFSVVNTALEDVPERMQELANRLEQLTRERQQVQQNIQRAPDQSVISPILEEINELNEKRGRLQKEIDDCIDRLGTLDTKIERIENDLEKQHEKQEQLEDVSERAELAEETRQVVQEYRAELVSEKLKQLESVLTDRYLRLTNKNEFYDDVVIDRENLTIEVETIHGDRKEQSQLSAGERQIFATALLWALAEISDRPLPFIIDTPLGRLDKKHRSNLVTRFFPDAAHQVFLFSTDTEITEEYYDLLQEDIAHEYLLEQDSNTGETHISPGYFWSQSADTPDTDVTHVEQQSQLPFNNE
jgi:DNA sulfur modification protein DndD